MKSNSYFQKPATIIAGGLLIILFLFYPKIINNNITNPWLIVISNPLDLLLILGLLCILLIRITIKDRKIVLNILFFLPFRKIKIENIRQIEQRSIALLCTTFDGTKSKVLMFPDVSNRERFLAELKEINSSIDDNNIH